MLFNSLEFALFLPVVLAIYYCLATRAQNLMLVVVSYFFYGWWDWRFLALLAFSTLLDYCCALGMEATRGKRRRWWLVASVCGNLGVLGFFKYFNFFADSAKTVLDSLGLQAHTTTLSIVLPVGISFYTFQTMAYTIDVYRSRVAARRDFTIVAVYVAYFPQLVAGPIERAQNLMGQFEKPRRVSAEQFYRGSLLILIGLFKKIAIADAVAPLVQDAFSNAGETEWANLWQGLWCFALQIYCDFSGYSDIARGTSRLLGIELMENFNQPYFSTNITEFWRRWHISLSTWLRDYLYIPLGGNRGGTLATYRNLMLTMVLGGLWHGANWTFVVWGTLHGVYLAVHKRFGRDARPEIDDARRGWPSVGQLCYGLLTFHLVMLTWLFFRSPDFATALDYISGIVTLRGYGDVPISQAATVAFYTALTLFIDIFQFRTGSHTAMLSWPWLVRGVVMFLMIVAIVLLGSYDETPFIYFQF